MKTKTISSLIVLLAITSMAVTVPSAFADHAKVTVEPTENIHTISGYKWSSSDGPPFQIESNTPCVAKITVNKKRPISLVMPFLKKTIGIVPVVTPLPAS